MASYVFVESGLAGGVCQPGGGHEGAARGLGTPGHVTRCQHARVVLYREAQVLRQ